MNNITLGQYVDGKSIIHKLDPRTKLLSLMLLMVSVFLIPKPLSNSFGRLASFIMLGAFAVIILIIVLFTRISLFKYLKSLKQLAFLFVFTFIIQLLTPQGDKILIPNLNLNLSILGLGIILLWVLLFIILRKFIPCKLIVFLILTCLSVYLLTYDLGYSFTTVTLNLYEDGLFNGAFFFMRIFLVIMLSTVLTLTTKPTDLTSAIEWYLHPLTYLKINVSIFAMIISLALRFIPTLFNETGKILKAQSSRGVDFKEGTLKQQIGQIISLLIPMLVISFKRAADLADAMEARGYIPGAVRSKLNVMKFRLSDLFSFIITIIIVTSIIVVSVI
jgi:energy-coupling factor transport system permease protein